MLFFYHPDKRPVSIDEQEKQNADFLVEGQGSERNRKVWRLPEYLNRKIDEIEHKILSREKSLDSLTLSDILPPMDREMATDRFTKLKIGKINKLIDNLTSSNKNQGGGTRLSEMSQTDQKNMVKFFNSILMRTLILVILYKTDSITINGSATNLFFPQQPLIDIDGAVMNPKFNEYPHFKPVFEPLFTQEEWDQIMGDQGKQWKNANKIGGAPDQVTGEIRDDQGKIFWGQIYGMWQNGVSISNPVSLERRKKFARVLFYNVQVLVLYFQLVKSTIGISGADLFTGNTQEKTINIDYFLQSLGLILDKGSRGWGEIKSRGFFTSGTIKNVPKNNAKYMEITDLRDVGELRTNCFQERGKYFGWLFGTSDDLSVKPFWFTGNPDDDIQFAYNEIVRKLLPEYILTAGSNLKDLESRKKSYKADDHPDIDYVNLESEVVLPRPVECEDKDCKKEVTIGTDTTAPPTKSKYIINNASFLHTTDVDKLSQKLRVDGEVVPRFGGFYNLDAMQARYSQFCPISSIADGMSLCSPGSEGSALSIANKDTQSTAVLSPIDVVVSYSGDDFSNFYLFKLKPVVSVKDWAERNPNYSIYGDVLKKLNQLAQFIKSLTSKGKAKKDQIMEKFREFFGVIDSYDDDLRAAIESVVANETIKKSSINAAIQYISQQMGQMRAELMKINYRADVRINGNDIVRMKKDGQSLLGLGPFSAVESYIDIIGSTAEMLSRVEGKSQTITGVLQKNITEILNMTIKKSMGDYSQEISTVAKFGGSGPYQPEKVEETQRIFNESNTNIVTEYGTKQVFPISMEYDNSGNSLRLFVANDRPSGMRGLFFVTQLLDGSFNEKSIAGFYGTKYKTEKKIKNGGNNIVGEGYDEETKGKPLLVKAPMVIPSQLPRYRLDKWDEDKDHREGQTGMDGNLKMVGEKVILFPSVENDLERWQQSQFKLKQEVKSGFTLSQATGNSDSGGDLELDLDNSSSSNSSNDNSSNNNNNDEEGSDEKSNVTQMNELRSKQYKIAYGGKRIKTRKRNKKISGNKTRRRHKI